MRRLPLGILAMISAMALTGPARAQSPEQSPGQRADAYIKSELDPNIVGAVFALPETERADVSKKLKLWREEVRTTIVEFEKTPVTRDAVAACLKTWVPDYKEEWVQRFLQETATVAELPLEARFNAIVEAYLQFHDTSDRAHYGRSPGHPPIRVTRVLLKECAAQSAVKKLNWLYNEGKPIPIGVWPYLSYRSGG